MLGIGAVLIDFGFSRLAPANLPIHSWQGTKSYVAPEMWPAGNGLARSYDAQKADVWALGIILAAVASTPAWMPLRQEERLALWAGSLLFGALLFLSPRRDILGAPSCMHDRVELLEAQFPVTGSAARAQCLVCSASSAASSQKLVCDTPGHAAYGHLTSR